MDECPGPQWLEIGACGLAGFWDEGPGGLPPPRNLGPIPPRRTAPLPAQQPPWAPSPLLGPGWQPLNPRKQPQQLGGPTCRPSRRNAGDPEPDGGSAPDVTSAIKVNNSDESGWSVRAGPGAPLPWLLHTTGLRRARKPAAEFTSQPRGKVYSLPGWLNTGNKTNTTASINSPSCQTD